MNDLTRSTLAGIVFFFACFTIYKAINLADAYLRYRIYRSYMIHLDNYPELDLAEFFEEQE